MLIDTHAHLDFDVYDEDRELVIQRAIENDVQGIITIGTDAKTSEQAVLLAEKYAAVFAAVGIHPTDCDQASEKDYARIAELAEHEKVVAIGEVGLDYYHMRAPKEVQKKAFIRQIELAQKLKRPLIIHNRDSHEDLYAVLTETDAGKTSGVLHSFSGDEAFLEKILLEHFYVSFTGNITFKKSSSDLLVKAAPLDRLLLETDSPFLTPVPLRGKRNEPAFIVHTAEKIAELKDLPLDEVGRVTSENAIQLFRLPL
ncbi:MAG TPA: TatD family deoxyribonuclease [Calditrichaeota bacterium]|nr:TatD family deoxyribonuclease [Calditrichota bacterium]